MIRGVLLSVALLYTGLGFCVEVDFLNEVLHSQTSPCGYPLNVKVFPGTHDNAGVLLCCHGYGGNASLADVISMSKVTDEHIVGFDFPDHDILERGFNYNTVSYGAIQEILPALYLLKKIAVDADVSKISLYGFSAGGGAIVNMIAVLNNNTHDAALRSVGIDSNTKAKILAALQRGTILLDAPLKSMDEIMAGRPYDASRAFVCQRYKANQWNPIDNLSKWKGLKLNVIVFFQNPDEAVLNRDDELYSQRLQQANPAGKNIIISKNEGGHCGFHRSLWQAFAEMP